MAFLMSRVHAFDGFLTPPMPPVESRRGGWPGPINHTPRCLWERDAQGALVRRWVLEGVASLERKFQ